MVHHKIANKNSSFFFLLTLLGPPWLLGSAHKNSIVFWFFVNLILFFNNILSVEHRNVILNVFKSKIFKYFLLPICVYLVVSVINYRGVYDSDLYFLEYRSYIKYLPTSLDKFATLKGIGFLLLCFLFYINAHCFNRQLRKKTKKCYKFFLSISAFSLTALIIVGIASRIIDTPNLLFIFEREYFSNSQLSFGSFGYRTNAGFYILTAGLWLYAETVNYSIIHHGKFRMRGLHILLILILGTAVFIVIKSRICLFLYMIFTSLIVISNFNHINKNQIMSIICKVMALIIVVSISITFSRLKESLYRVHTNPNNIVTKQIKIQFSYHMLSNSSKNEVAYFTDSFNGNFKKFFLAIYQAEDKISLRFVDRIKNLEFTESVSILQSSGIGHIRILFNESSFIIQSLDTEELVIESKQLNLTTKLSTNFIIKRLKLNNINNIFGKSSTPRVNTLTILGPHDEVIFREKFSKLNFFQFLDSVSSGRNNLYYTSLKILQDYPIFGVGFNNWNLAYNINKDIGIIPEAWLHNDPLQLIIELGLLGVAILIAIIYKIFVIFGKLCHKSPNRVHFLTTWVGLLLVLIGSLFDFPFHTLPFTFAFLFAIIRFLTIIKQLEPNK